MPRRPAKVKAHKLPAAIPDGTITKTEFFAALKKVSRKDSPDRRKANNEPLH